MDELIKEGKLNSPAIDFNPTSGLLKIIGRSIPENPVKFYQPLEHWISDFLATNPQNVTLFIYLDYLNTHSTECILILMKKLESYLQSSQANVKIVWNFDEDDEDMETLGEDLASIAEVPFEFKEVAEEG